MERGESIDCEEWRKEGESERREGGAVGSTAQLTCSRGTCSEESLSSSPASPLSSRFAEPFSLDDFFVVSSPPGFAVLSTPPPPGSSTTSVSHTKLLANAEIV
eukprot:3920665-Rhodomonas_salina.1